MPTLDALCRIMRAMLWIVAFSFCAAGGIFVLCSFGDHEAAELAIVCLVIAPLAHYARERTPA